MRDVVPRVYRKEGGCYMLDSSQELGFQVVRKLDSRLL